MRHKLPGVAGIATASTIGPAARRAGAAAGSIEAGGFEPPHGGIKIRCLAASVLFLIPEIPHDRRQDRLKSVDLGEINDNEAGDAGRRRRKGWRR
jgi:hypothetical protein